MSVSLMARVRESRAAVGRVQALLAVAVPSQVTVAGVIAVLEALRPRLSGDVLGDLDEVIAELRLFGGVENKYDPGQKRDRNGQWTDGMPEAVVSADIKVLGGTVTASADPDSPGKATLSVGDRSVTLTTGELRQLRRQVINAQYGDDKHAADDGVFRVFDSSTPGSQLLVSLRPVDGAFVTETGKRVPSIEAAPEDEEVYSAEFDMVIDERSDGEFDDEPKIRVSLKDLDDRNRKGVYQALDRATTARRVDTGNGPTDVFSPRPGAVGLRMKDDQGKPTEVILNARDFKRIDSAVNDVLYGEGEGLDTGELAEYRDSAVVVETSGGQVEVRFKGRRVNHEWEGALTVVPLGGEPWGVAVSDHHIDEFFEAFEANGAISGVTNAALVLPRAKYDPTQKRDGNGRWTRTGTLGSVLEKLDSLRDKLSDEDRAELDRAMDQLRGLKSSDVDDWDLDDDEQDEDDDEPDSDGDGDSEDDGEDDNAYAAMESPVGELTFIPYDDGDVVVTWDDGDVVVTQESGREVADAVAQFSAMPRVAAPETPDPPSSARTEAELQQWYREWHESNVWDDYNAVQGDLTTSDGEWRVVRYGSGVIEVGGPESVGPGTNSPGVLQLDEAAEAEEFASLLREALDTAAGIAGPTNRGWVSLFARVVWSRRRLNKFDPNQARDEDGRWTDGPDFGLPELEVMDDDAYTEVYGEVIDEADIDLGDGQLLTVRYFDGGDLHVAVDYRMDDGTYSHQVLFESVPEQLRELAYDVEDVLNADDPSDTDDHGAYVGRDEVGDVQFGPEWDVYVDLGESEARELVEALRNIADGYDEHDFGDEEAASVSAAAKVLPRNHPGGPGHDQKSHGRRRKKLPDLPDVPDVPDVATPGAVPPSKPKAPAKRAPRKKAPARTAEYVSGTDLLAGADPAILGQEIWDQSKDFEDVGDNWLHVIARRQGFDGVPEVVTKAEMTRLLKAGGYVELARGVEAKGGRSGADFSEQFRSGDYFAGFGYYGNGIYATTHRPRAEDYSDSQPGSVLRLALRPDARVVDEDELRKEYLAYDARARTSVGGAVFQDPGRYAAARGYDAIRRPVKDMPGAWDYVVLNRTAVLVEEAGRD